MLLLNVTRSGIGTGTATGIGLSGGRAPEPPPPQKDSLLPLCKGAQNQSYLYLFAKSCGACRSSNNAPDMMYGCTYRLQGVVSGQVGSEMLSEAVRYEHKVWVLGATRLIACDCRCNMLVYPGRTERKHVAIPVRNWNLLELSNHRY